MSEPDKPQSPEQSPAESERRPKQIPLVSVPNDREMIAEEMAELFEEDEVTHQHGTSHPEAD